jgi:predicted O-linked N-acetylglucosamine transferase (SPINDLY family)
MEKQDEQVSILISLGTEECQHISILKKINDFYKKLTGKKFFDIENFDDFILAFKTCNSIGLCSIITQFVTNCYYLYDSKSKIIKHRNYYDKMIKYMIVNTGPIYENIHIMNTFLNRNNSYKYAYHDISNTDLFKNIAKLQSKLCPDLLFNSVNLHTEKIKESKKIKVGFISDFVITFHSVAKDRLGIIKHLYNDPEFDVKIMTRKNNIHIFYNKIMSDIDSSNLIVKMDENDLVSNRKQIAEQNFDIIVYPEIGMCQQTRLIAFSRLAPIQINTWGHSDTSGLPNIDYFVSSKLFNSEEDQDCYSEKLILFDSLGTYYYDVFNFFKNEIQLEENKDTSTNALRNNIIEKTGIENPNIYGCIQIFIKIHPSFIYTLNEILKADENGVIVLLSTNKGDNDDVMFTNYIKSKIQHFERIYFIYQVPFIQYAQNIKNCDLILDYFPFGGFNSTIESFLLGKVCITYPGTRISGKFTQGLYRKMGITEFICDSEKEYVSKAVEYGKNRDERKRYEEKILENVHKIIEEKESIDEWKILLKNLHNKK